MSDPLPLGFFSNKDQYSEVLDSLRQGRIHSLIGITHLAYYSSIKAMRKLKIQGVRLVLRYIMIAKNIHEKRAHFTLASLHKYSINKHYPLIRLEGFKTLAVESRVVLHKWCEKGFSQHYKPLYKFAQKY